MRARRRRPARVYSRALIAHACVFARRSFLVDSQLLVFVRKANGTLCIKTVSPSTSYAPHSWPPAGTDLPGTVVDCQASSQGLIVIALATPDSKGLLMIVTCPRMTTVAEMPLDGKPQSILLYQVCPLAACAPFHDLITPLNHATESRHLSRT